MTTTFVTNSPAPETRTDTLTKTAFITGISGQDGSYLTELLLNKGYLVHGIVRRTSSTVRSRLDGFFNDPAVYRKRLFLHYADLDDATTIRRLLNQTRPDELYHLAGQSHVGASFEIPESTCQFTAMGTLRLLEIIRDADKPPRFLHISSSEIFGRPSTSPQDEQTAVRPVSPYGVAKAFATQMVTLYRESFGLFACNAICYNHESERRGESFVTRKISRAAAAIFDGRQDTVALGNLDGRRDWGYAPEYVDAMWRMLQCDAADDFVLSTGQDASVKDFLAACFDCVGLDWKNHVTRDERFMRPAEVNRLVGNSSKAETQLGWKATTRVAGIAEKMVWHDLRLIESSAGNS